MYCIVDLIKPALFFRFTAKTKNKWSERHNFKKVPGKYDLIQLDFSPKQVPLKTITMHIAHAYTRICLIYQTDDNLGYANVSVLVQYIINFEMIRFISQQEESSASAVAKEQSASKASDSASSVQPKCSLEKYLQVWRWSVLIEYCLSAHCFVHVNLNVNVTVWFTHVCGLRALRVGAARAGAGRERNGERSARNGVRCEPSAARAHQPGAGSLPENRPTRPFPPYCYSICARSLVHVHHNLDRSAPASAYKSIAHRIFLIASC